jgi:hypothetical protein
MFIQAGILCKWANDSQRFLLEYIDIIHNSPSHLPFISPIFPFFILAPHESYVAELLQEVKVVRGLPAEWGKCSRTVLLG